MVKRNSKTTRLPKPTKNSKIDYLEPKTSTKLGPTRLKCKTVPN